MPSPGTNAARKPLAKSGATMGVGVALAVVITQMLAAAGVQLGEQVVGPLGVVLGAVVQELRHRYGDDHA